MDLRFIVAFLLIMFKGLIRTYNQAGTFLLPLSKIILSRFYAYTSKKAKRYHAPFNMPVDAVLTAIMKRKLVHQ